MKTIVVLVDFSDMTFKLLRQAHDLAKAFDGEVVLMHVVPPSPVVIDAGISPTVYEKASPESAEADRKKLVELRDSLLKFGVHTSIRQFVDIEVADLLEECRKLKSDIIIVGSHGHGSFYNLLVGSVTASVLKKAPCPVLVVPQPEEKESVAAAA